MIVNDHILKQAYGTWWTGKLSDAAGLVFLPALVALVVALVAPRLSWRGTVAVALGATATTFVWVKVTSGGAATASGLLSSLTGPGIIRQDATDLLALPFLGIAVLIARHSATANTWKVAVVLPVAVLATAATTAPHNYASGVLTVKTVDDQVFAGDGEVWGYEPAPTSWWVSGEGAHFVKVSDEIVPGKGSDAPIACLDWDPNVCFRAYAGHLGVERSDDAGGTWSVDWEVPPVQQEALVNEYNLYDVENDGAPHPELVETRDVAIIGDASGYYVYAANGVDGVAMRSPSGTWERIGGPGYPHWEPAPALAPILTPSDYQDYYASRLVFAMGLLAATLAIGGVVALNTNARRAPRTWWKIGAGVSIVAAAMMLGSFDSVAAFLSGAPTTTLPDIALTLTVSAVSSLIMALAMFSASPAKGFAGIGASIAVAVVAASFASALPVNFRTQTLLGLALAVVLACALAYVFRRWLKRSPEPSPPGRSASVRER